MKRNLKALGLALVAAFAMSAVAASAASAESTFTQPDEDYPVALTGHEEPETVNKFEITPNGNQSSIECDSDSVTYESTLNDAETAITVTPHYTECEAHTSIGTLDAKVDLNGCNYVFYATEEINATEFEGEADLVCPEPHESITVTVGGSNFCTVHVPEQKIKNGITYTNKNGEVTIDVNVNDLTYQETKKSIFCPVSNEEVTHDGVFISSVTVKGYKDLGTHTWTTVDPNGTETELETLTEGAQIDIDVG